MANLSVVPATNLSQPEKERLAELEGVVERGQQTFIEVGQALLEIRDRRLYRETHSTFEGYCRERGLGRNYANKIIAASEVAGILGTRVPIETEAQARELVPLRDNPDALTAAWQAAQEQAAERGKPVTAAIVRGEVNRSLTGRAPTEAERAFAEPILKEVIAERWMDPLYAAVDDLQAAVEWAQQESFGLRRRDHINQLRALVAKAGQLVNSLEDIINARTD